MALKKICIKGIIPVLLLLLCSTVIANKQTLSGLINFDDSAKHLSGNNRDSTDMYFAKDDICGFGFNYCYDFISIKYTVSNTLQSHTLDISLVLANIVLETNNEYSTNTFKRNGPPNWEPGEKWLDEYEGTLFTNVTTYSTRSQIGYLFSLDPFSLFSDRSNGVGQFSYKAAFYQTERNKPNSMYVGVITGVSYLYTCFKSDDQLIPEGERVYYNDYATYRGESYHALSMSIAPMVCKTFEKNFLMVGVHPVNILSYKQGEIYCEENNKLKQYDMFDAWGLFFRWGYTGDIFVFKCEAGLVNSSWYQIDTLYTGTSSYCFTSSCGVRF